MLLLIAGSVTAQNAATTHEAVQPSQLRKTILEHDARFWATFNTCDLPTIESYLTEDVEFYHDRNGFSKTRDVVMESIRSGLCAGNDPRLRREAVAESLHVYPLNNYGAIITGVHLFHITEEGSPERPDSIARFTHVWRYADGEWRMSRVLSYDHRPPPVAVPEEATDVTAEVLARYAGEYGAPGGPGLTVTAQPDALHIRFGQFSETIRPSSATQFFHPQRPLTFEFVVGEGDRVEALVVRENGKIVQTAPKRAAASD